MENRPSGSVISCATILPCRCAVQDKKMAYSTLTLTVKPNHHVEDNFIGHTSVKATSGPPTRRRMASQPSLIFGDFVKRYRHCIDAGRKTWHLVTIGTRAMQKRGTEDNINRYQANLIIDWFAYMMTLEAIRTKG